jgi:hypothetical protein
MPSAVVIPWGKSPDASGEARERVWTKVRALWEQTSVDLIIAADPGFAMTGKFSVGNAINRAVSLAPPEYEKFVLFGADMLPSVETVEWAAEQLDTEPWTLLFDRGAELEEFETNEFVAVGALGLPAMGVQPFPTPCVGPIAFTRTAFDKVGGFDPRYRGYGWEDVDLWLQFQRTVPRSTPQNYPGTPLIQLWHPTGHRDRTMGNANTVLFHQKWG